MLRSTIHRLLLALVLLSLLLATAAASSAAAPDGGLEVPQTSGQTVDRALNEGIDGDTMAMVVGIVVALGMFLRGLLPILRANRVVGWGLNIALTAGATVFVYLAEDLRLDLSVVLDILKGALLAAGGWNAVKAVAPGPTKTGAPAATA